MAYHGFKPAEQAIQIGADEILSSHISDGVIVNADVNASAAIATSKVSGAVTSIGSHGLGSLATLSAVASAQITDGTIVNADVNNSAAIVTSKLSGSLTSVGSHGLATSATTDTTNASNISSGTLAAARVATLNQSTTGQAGTVATIAGLAPNTATTQAAQSAITSVGTLTGLSVGISAVSKAHIYENTTATDSSAGLTIEQAGTGDAILQFLETGTQRWVMGLDNSDSDKFKISSDGDLNTNARLTIDTSGNATFAGTITTTEDLAAGNATFGGNVKVGNDTGKYVGTAGGNQIIFSGSPYHILYNSVSGHWFNLDSNASGLTGDFVIGKDRTGISGGTTYFTLAESNGNATFAGKIAVEHTNTPQYDVHIEGGGELLLSHATDTVGESAKLLFRSEGGESDGALRIKGGIFFQRTGDYGRGDMYLANLGTQSNSSVTSADYVLKLDSGKNATFSGDVTIGGNFIASGTGLHTFAGKVTSSGEVTGTGTRTVGSNSANVVKTHGADGDYDGDIVITVTHGNYHSTAYDIKVAAYNGSAHFAGMYYQNSSIFHHHQSVNATDGQCGGLTLANSSQNSIFTIALASGNITHPCVRVEITSGNGGIGQTLDESDITISMTT